MGRNSLDTFQRGRFLSRSLLFLACLNPFFLFAQESAQVVDRVAAVVNNDPIMLSDLRWLILYRGLREPEGEQERAEFYASILDQLIDQKLIAAEALQTPGIEVGPGAVAEQVAVYRKRFKTDQEFQLQLRRMKMSEDDLNELIHRQLAVLRFVKIRFEPFIIVLPDQIEVYYKEELLTQLAEGAAVPSLELVQEQIRQILTLTRVNQEIDNWVQGARSKARVEVLLSREPRLSPNLPPGLDTELEMRPVKPPGG
jgi:hypothetical protein